MPVPADVREHLPFATVFGDRQPLCTPVTLSAARRVYLVEDRVQGYDYKLQAWSGLQETEIRPAVSLASHTDAASIHEQKQVETVKANCYGMPEQIPGGGVLYDDVICSIRHVPAGCGWVSSIIDQQITLAR